MTAATPRWQRGACGARQPEHAARPRRGARLHAALLRARHTALAGGGSWARVFRAARTARTPTSAQPPRSPCGVRRRWVAWTSRRTAWSATSWRAAGAAPACSHAHTSAAAQQRRAARGSRPRAERTVWDVCTCTCVCVGRERRACSTRPKDTARLAGHVGCAAYTAARVPLAAPARPGTAPLHCPQPAMQPPSRDRSAPSRNPVACPAARAAFPAVLCCASGTAPAWSPWSCVTSTWCEATTRARCWSASDPRGSRWGGSRGGWGGSRWGGRVEGMRGRVGVGWGGGWGLGWVWGVGRGMLGVAGRGTWLWACC